MSKQKKSDGQDTNLHRQTDRRTDENDSYITLKLRLRAYDLILQKSFVHKIQSYLFLFSQDIIIYVYMFFHPNFVCIHVANILYIKLYALMNLNHI